MLMLKTTHAAVVAAKDAEIERAGERARMYAGLLTDCRLNNSRLIDECNGLATQVARLEARLAVFTAPRARGPKGHFLPTKAPIDHMIEALEAL
jgi:hypothetical protein